MEITNPYSIWGSSEKNTDKKAADEKKAVEKPKITEKIQIDVARLLQHAVKKPDLDMKKERLNQIVPLLDRCQDKLDDKDKIELWDALNYLSNKLAPVTAETLEVHQELNYPEGEKRGPCTVKKDLRRLIWFLVVIVVFVVAVLGYSILMGNYTADFGTLDADYTKVLGDEKTTRQARKEGQSKDDEEPLRSILAQKTVIEAQFLWLAEKQCNLMRLDGLRLDGFCQNFEKWRNLECAKPGQSRSEDAACPPDYGVQLYSAVQSIAKSGKAIDKVLNSLVLPLLLGFLGAAAFLTRNTLQHLKDFTYAPSSIGRYLMRVLLGGLLGLIGPWLYTSGKVDGIGLGLFLFAFLLGYSVELAFSLLDRFIRYARDAIRPKSEPPAGSGSAGTGSGTAGSGSAMPENKKEERNAVDTSPARERLADLRGRLREIESLEPVFEAALPPEMFENEIQPKTKAAGQLLRQLDQNLDAPDVDPARLEKAVNDAIEQSKSFTGANHPLTLVLRSALVSFAEAVGSDAPTGGSSEIALSLFVGAVAAFGKGTGVYERWMAYTLSQPYIVRQSVGTPSELREARECLDDTRIFRRIFSGASDELAIKIMALARTEKTSDELAAEIWNAPTLLEGFTGDLWQAFSDAEEFEEGWVEYRRCLLRQALKQDFPDDSFPDGEASAPRVGAILSMIEKLREERASAKDLDILASLADGLMKAAQKNSNLDVVGLIRRLLPDANTTG